MRPGTAPLRWIAALCLLAALGISCGEPVASIAVGVDGCSACGMLIQDKDQAAGYLEEGSFRPFCSAGCLLDSYERVRRRGATLPGRVVFGDYGGGGLQPAAEAGFLVTCRLPIVMDWDFVAFATVSEANRHREGEERVVDWNELRRIRGVPDRSLQVLVTPAGLVPERVELRKGELVVLEMRAEGLGEDWRLRFRGYEEIGEVRVPASGEIESVRFLARRPGDGFPVLRSGDGAAVGRIGVEGSHMPGEEEL